MYRNMNDWAEIRRRVLAGGVSRRQILRETGMHRKTLKKILEHSEPPGYRQQKPRPRKKLGAFLERIRQILKDDQAMPRKQRHTAKRIWERLQEDGFTGGYTVVKDAVRELTQKNQEVFDGSTAGSPDPPGSHPGSQRPELPADGCQTPAETEVSPTNLRPQEGASWRLAAPPPAASTSKRNQPLD